MVAVEHITITAAGLTTVALEHVAVTATMQLEELEVSFVPALRANKITNKFTSLAPIEKLID